MHPSFADLQAAFARELAGLSVEEVEWHADGSQERWNSRQIVEHLLLTYCSSSKVFLQRLEKGRPTLSQPTRRQRIARFVVLRAGKFPGRPQAPAHVTPSVIPCEVRAGCSLAIKFSEELQVMDEVLSRCEERFAGDRFATHQILGALSAEEWRRFHVVHSRHHLSQLLSLKRQFHKSLKRKM